MEKELIKILADSGLGKKGAMIYLVVLELKSATISTISRRTDLPRATVYDTLKELQKKGFIGESQKKKVSHFVATDPRVISERNRELWQKTEQLMPKLIQLTDRYQNIPYVVIYEGPEGLKTAAQEILKTASNNISSYGSNEELYNYFPDIEQWFVKNRINKNIAAKEIMEYSDASLSELKKAKKEKRQIRILPEDSKLSSYTVIYNDKVAIFSFQNETAVIIQDQPYADTQRQLFELMWQQLK